MPDIAIFLDLFYSNNTDILYIFMLTKSILLDNQEKDLQKIQVKNLLFPSDRASDYILNDSRISDSSRVSCPGFNPTTSRTGKM